MSKTNDRYLAKAEAARGKAEGAATEQLQVEWLQVAGAWMELAAADRRSAGEKIFDELSDVQGTGQAYLTAANENGRPDRRPLSFPRCSGLDLKT